MEDILILGHMGLGDHIICNGLYRYLSKNYYQVNVICKKIYFDTLTKMFFDVSNIKFIHVLDDNEAVKYVNNYQKYYDKTLKIGSFGKNFIYNKFCESFYNQASIPYNIRWKEFHIPYEKNDFINQEKYIFLHDDPERNLNIDKNKILSKLKFITPQKDKNFLYYIDIIKNANEIHCFDSSFALLADHFSTTKKIYLHRYVRPYIYPIYQKDWKVIW